MSKPTYPTLAAAKVAAQAKVGAAYKDARNDHAKYPYASKEEIARTAKDALAEVGLSFELRGPTGPASDGWIPFRGRFDHESGESEEWDVWWDSDGLRMSSGAAKTGAVMSYAHKNSLLNALNIPRETEEVHRNRVDQQPNPQSPRKRAPKKKAAPKPPPAAVGTPRRDEFSDVLKSQLNCTRDDVDSVVRLLSNGALSNWSAAAKDEAACEQLTAAARDFLTTFNAAEIIEKARQEAQA
jgi:hypothetical protein